MARRSHKNQTLVSTKAEKMESSVVKLREQLKKAERDLAAVKKEETNKALITLGEKIIKTYHITSVEDLDSWFEQLKLRYPYQDNSEEKTYDDLAKD